MSDRTRTPPEQGPDPLPPNAADARQAMEEFGRAPSTGHVFNYVRSITGPDGVPTVPIDPATCPHCSHQHTGVESAYICIGCPCEYRPCSGSGQHPRAVRTGEVQNHGHGSEPVYLSHCLFCDKPFPPSDKMPRHWMIPWTEDDVASVTFKHGGVIEGIEPTPFPFTLTDNAGEVTLLDKCDGQHPAPPCKDEQCYHVAPPVGQATILVRWVGPHAELLCELCELPLNAEPITLVEITDEEPASGEPDPEFHVWHLACARKEAEAQEGAP